MPSRNELERERYEADLKWTRDEQARIQDARAEGFAEAFIEGRAEGARVGYIQYMQSVLGEPVTPEAELFELGLPLLTTMANEIERRWRARTAHERSQ